jgi:sugar diacid utilization regulator/GAF domain-containing protein
VKARSDRTAEHLQGWLSALAGVGASVNRGISLDELLDIVARTACELMDYNFCSVTLPDASSQVLLIEGSYGLSAEYIREVNAMHPIRLHGASLPSPSSQAYRLGIPIQIEDTETSPSFAPWAGAARDQGFAAMIAVPLIASGETLGTLNCFTRLSRHFAKDEVSLLSVLADQAAIAITTARLRAEQARTIARLHSLNEALEEQYETQRQVAEVHDRLTALALAGGGIAEVANALAELLARPVIVRSGNGTVVCGSGLRADGLLEKLSEAASLQNRSASSDGDTDSSLVDILLTLGDGSSVVAVRAPVLIKEEVVAWIWTTGPVAELAPVDRRAIEHAATVMALELLSVSTAADAAWRQSAELLTGLLSGLTSAPSLGAQAESLGCDLSQPHAMIVTLHDRKHGEAFQNRLSRALRGLIGETRPQPLVGAYEDYIVALWPLGRKALESVRYVSDEIRLSVIDGASDSAGSLSVLMGPVTDPTRYPEAFSIGRGAVELAKIRGIAGQTLLLTDLGMAGLFLQVPDSFRLHSYCEEVLGPLRRHDTSHNTTLIQTLSLLVRNDLDARVTAEQSFVHRNTIVRRRQLIEDLLGFELTNVAALAHVAAALQLEEVIAARQTSNH